MNMLHDTQAFAEDVLNISMRKTLLIAVEICVCTRVTCFFRRWAEVAQSTYVATVREMLDAWMRMKQALIFSATRRQGLLEDLAIERLRSSELSQSLAACRVQRAELDFERLQNALQNAKK